jgi:hypothetical protein
MISGYIERENGKGYVVLRRERAILALYSVRINGKLKRVSRWPKDIE